MSGCGFLISSVGSSSLGVAGVLATGMTLAWAGDLLVFMMAPCANAIRMLHGLSRYKCRILAMIGMAMAIGLVGGVCTILVLSYHYGANNYHGSWAWFAKEPFRVAQNFALQSDWPQLGWLAVERSRRGHYGAVDLGAAPPFVVAVPPAGLSGQRHLDTQQRLVQYLPRVAGQGTRAEVHWAEWVQGDAVVFSRHGAGAVRRRGLLDGRRWVYGHDRE